jgi:hypothetical protein
MNWRCLLGHDWSGSGWTDWEPYTCDRCDAESKACGNCGRFHNPQAIVICTVTR